MMNTVLFVKIFSGLFALVNPLLGLSVFLSFTENARFFKRAEMAFFTGLTIFAILAGSTYAGPEILKFFGIKISSFQIAGGLIVGVVAFSMLNGRPGFGADANSEQHTNPAVIPLAFPIMVGPGSISKVIAYSVGSSGVEDIFAIYMAVAAIAGLTFFIFLAGNIFSRILGRTGVITVTKILALLLGAMAVDIVISGIKGSFMIH